MAVKVIMPSLGQTTDEIMVVRWLKKKGDRVEKGEPLLEIQTDKATMEVEAFTSGTVLALITPEGQMAHAGETIAYLGQPGEQVPAPPSAEGRTTVDKPIETRSALNAAISAPAPAKANRIIATPAAKALAKELGIDLTRVVPSSPDQVIQKEDVQSWATSGQNITGDTSISPDEGELVVLSPMRRRIAQRMLESKQIAPHFYLSTRIDMSQVIELRKAISAGSEPGLAYHDFFIRAIAVAIGKFPEVNSTMVGSDKVRLYHHVNVGLAVKVEAGLVVPVVHDVQSKSLLEIAKCSASLVERARNGKLRPEEMTGGTITLTNLGMFAVTSFAAIINQPESAILAVGRTIETPVALDGEIAIRPILEATLSVDHRVVDGAVAAGFLEEFKLALEEPSVLQRAIGLR